MLRVCKAWGQRCSESHSEQDSGLRTKKHPLQMPTVARLRNPVGLMQASGTGTDPIAQILS